MRVCCRSKGEKVIYVNTYQSNDSFVANDSNRPGPVASTIVIY